MTPYRRVPVLALWLAVSAACGDGGVEAMSREAPPAAAVVAPGPEAGDLASQLDALARELERGRAGEPERLLTAEAITDRLLHAERPVDWLATGYDVEARLRQLQAMADRVVARLRRGARIGAVQDDLDVLVAAVADLQARLAEPGGGAAPIPLDSLLAQDPLRDVNAPSLGAGADSIPEAGTERDDGLLGEPIGDAADTVPGRDR